MARAFEAHGFFLDEAIIDMGTARIECNSLSTRLLEEVGQVTSGWTMADWAVHETRVLKEVANELEGLLKSFQLEQRMFYGAQFENRVSMSTVQRSLVFVSRAAYLIVLVVRVEEKCNEHSNVIGIFQERLVLKRVSNIYH